MADSRLNSGPSTGFEDINDAFDNIALIEDIYRNKGFQEGSKVASDRDRREGFILGVKKGSEVGSEVGFFQSFAKVWIKLIEVTPTIGDKKQEKAKKELERLLSLANDASDENSKEDDVWNRLNQMRSKYTLICKLLRLDTVDTTDKNISW